jgi:hypothetical protein
LAILSIEQPYLPRFEKVVVFRVSSRKLLESERAMSKNLAADISRTVNLETDVCHLERGPVLVVDEVLNELFTGVIR